MFKEPLNQCFACLSLTNKSNSDGTVPLQPVRVVPQSHTPMAVWFTYDPHAECCWKGRPVDVCKIAKVSVVPSVDPQLCIVILC